MRKRILFRHDCASKTRRTVASAAARSAGCDIVTMCGVAVDNPLRKLGDLNLYVASQEYGFVEAAHLGLCHAWIDFAMGWGSETDASISDVRDFAA